MHVTIHNNVDQTFWIFYFLCVFGFLTQKQVKIYQNNIQSKKKKTNTNLSKHARTNTKKMAKSQHIGRIDAWTCSNAYA